MPSPVPIYISNIITLKDIKMDNSLVNIRLAAIMKELGVKSKAPPKVKSKVAFCVKQEVAVEVAVEVEIEVTQKGVENAVMQFMSQYGFNGFRRPVRLNQVHNFAAFAQVVFDKYPNNVGVRREIRALFEAIDDLSD